MSLASLGDVFRKLYGTLEASAVEYMAYGGIAVGVWGDPRETQDVDAVVSVAPAGCQSLLEVLRAAGFRHNADDPTTFPIDGWIRLRYAGRHADLALGRTPFDRSALNRRQRRTLFNQEVWLVAAEDLILYKLIAHRFKDLADAEAVVRRQGERLDVTYLREWALEIAVHTRRFEVPQKLEQLLKER